jgi:SM-20-related protein
MLPPRVTQQLYQQTIKAATEGDALSGLSWQEGCTANKFDSGSLFSRGDRYSWLMPGTAAVRAAPLKQLVQLMQALGEELSSFLHLNYPDWEQMLAYYPPRLSGHDSHRDMYELDYEHSSDLRRVTALTYANPHWQPSHGGQLRVWLQEGADVDIEPKAGRVIVFLSGAVEHEVRPAFHPRVACTTWFF